MLINYWAFKAQAVCHSGALNVTKSSIKLIFKNPLKKGKHLAATERLSYARA